MRRKMKRGRRPATLAAAKGNGRGSLNHSLKHRRCALLVSMAVLLTASGTPACCAGRELYILVAALLPIELSDRPRGAKRPACVPVPSIMHGAHL